MARKRMFDKEIISQDSFLELPMDAKALYFLLGMEADDEGFVSYRKVLRLYGGTEDSVRILALKNYIIPFKTGVVVITDWKRNNYLDKNKIKETIYQNEKSLLTIDKNLEQYKLNESLTGVKPMFNKSLPSIEENRIEESSIDKSSIVVPLSEDKSSPSSTKANEIQENSLKDKELSTNKKTAKANKHKYGEYKNVLLKDEELQKLKDLYDNWKELITYLDEYIEMKGYKAKSHYLCIRKWVVDAVKRKNEKQKPKKRNLSGEQRAYSEKDLENLYVN